MTTRSDGGSAGPPHRPPTLLSALPEAGRERVLAAARRRTYADGDVLVRQGDEAASIYLLESGRVVVRYMTPSGDSVILGVMGPGEMLGEGGLFSGRQERSASVQAVGEVVARVLREDQLAALRAAHPEVDDFLLAALARRVDRLSRLVAEAHYVPVGRRVARRLFEAARAFADGPGPVVVPLTQDDLAALAGATRPTVNPVLRKLAADGVVRVLRGRVEVLDAKALRARCGW